MKTILERDIKLPDYSLSYLINGDSSGINEEDIALIDNWYKTYTDRLQSGESIVISLPEDEYPEFTWAPEFGLACNCFNCMITILG